MPALKIQPISAKLFLRFNACQLVKATLAFLRNRPRTKGGDMKNFRYHDRTRGPVYALQIRL